MNLALRSFIVVAKEKEILLLILIIIKINSGGDKFLLKSKCLFWDAILANRRI